jgi:hypothetical protein
LVREEEQPEVFSGRTGAAKKERKSSRPGRRRDQREEIRKGKWDLESQRI